MKKWHLATIVRELAQLEAESDPKALYRHARAGLIPEFTGVSVPYESPEAPELVVDTTTASIEESTQEFIDGTSM